MKMKHKTKLRSFLSLALVLLLMVGMSPAAFAQAPEVQEEAAPAASAQAEPEPAPPEPEQPAAGLGENPPAEEQPEPPAEPENPPAPQDQALLDLAAADPTGAAGAVNAVEAQGEYLRLLKLALDYYYGNNALEALEIFAAALDARAAETLQRYANAKAERDAGEQLNYLAGSVLVVFEDLVDEHQAEEVVAERAGALDETVDSPLEQTVAVAEVSLEQTVEQAVEQLSSDPAVQYAQPIFRYVQEGQEEEQPPAGDEVVAGTQAVTVNDPSVNDGTMWHWNKIDVLGSWDLLQRAGSGGRTRVRVAVLDGQIDMDHADLQANLNKSFARSFVGGVESSPNTPKDNHGTHVAGIIGATANNALGVAGIASGPSNSYIEIMPLNVFDADGYAYTTALTTAIAFAANNGARVLNMSLGYLTGNTPYWDQYLADVVNSAYQSGCLIVAAAGNNGTDASYYPSDIPSSMGVINITNADYTNPAINPRVSGSNYGANKDISAPGASIYSTVTGSRYSNMSGTSMAAPMVTAAAALVFYADPMLSGAQVREVLTSTATDLYTPGKDNQTAWGCVNPTAAVAKALGVILDEQNFPDATFRNLLRTRFAGGRGNIPLSSGGASAIVTLDVAGMGIGSLAGIELFTALKTLDCSGNKLTALNLGANRALQSLNCSGNQIATLDLSKNTAISYSSLNQAVVAHATASGGNYVVDFAALFGANRSKVSFNAGTLTQPGFSYNSSTGLLTIAMDKVNAKGLYLGGYLYPTGRDAMKVDLAILVDGLYNGVGSFHYLLGDQYLTNVAKGSTVAELKSNLFSSNVVVRSASGAVLADNARLATGATVQGGSESYTVVIYGDVDGNGVIDAQDLLATKRHILRLVTLEGGALQAAAMGGSAVMASSMLEIQRDILGIRPIDQYRKAA